MLFICTGNVCRTPMAVGFFNHRSSELGLDDHATSVGLWRNGEPATTHGVSVMAGLGIDTSHHRSRVLDATDLDAPDLIIGLAREHVREAVVLDTSVLERTFTLKELVRLAEEPGGARLVGVGESVRAWALRLSGGRRPSDLLGQHPEDDVADPIGRSRRAYEDTATEIGDLIDRMLRVMHPEVAQGRVSA